MSDYKQSKRDAVIPSRSSSSSSSSSLSSKITKAPFLCPICRPESAPSVKDAKERNCKECRYFAECLHELLNSTEGNHRFFQPLDLCQAHFRRTSATSSSSSSSFFSTPRDLVSHLEGHHRCESCVKYVHHYFVKEEGLKRHIRYSHQLISDSDTSSGEEEEEEEEEKGEEEEKEETELPEKENGGRDRKGKKVLH